MKISLKSSSKDLVLNLEQVLLELEKDDRSIKEIKSKVRKSINSAKSIESCSRRVEDISL